MVWMFMTYRKNLLSEKAVGHCVRTHSRLKQLFMYDITGFYNVSGYCFLISEVSSCTPRGQKVGVQEKFSARFARRMYPPPLSKTWRRP